MKILFIWRLDRASEEINRAVWHFLINVDTLNTPYSVSESSKLDILINVRGSDDTVNYKSVLFFNIPGETVNYFAFKRLKYVTFECFMSSTRQSHVYDKTITNMHRKLGLRFFYFHHSVIIDSIIKNILPYMWRWRFKNIILFSIVPNNLVSVVKVIQT